jgi:hypothetical protein
MFPAWDRLIRATQMFKLAGTFSMGMTTFFTDPAGGHPMFTN